MEHGGDTLEVLHIKNLNISFENGHHWLPYTDAHCHCPIDVYIMNSILCPETSSY